jgi:hypothetical protein
MTDLSRITIAPDVCGGRPCIRGLRIRVKDILDLDSVLNFAAKQNDHPVLRST